MTALKPTESRLVRAVSSQRYPLNAFCASPMSDAGTKADDPHHCFPRSAIGGDSWFVEFYDEEGSALSDPIPHVIGLSREQHERVESHEAWIQLEDGVWNWYERITNAERASDTDSCWEFIGPLNPQPGSTEGKPKRRVFRGEAKRQRTNWQVKVPKDQVEDGAGELDDLFALAWVHLCEKEGLDPEDGTAFTRLHKILYTVATL